jgi:Terminase small subunit
MPQPPLRRVEITVIGHREIMSKGRTKHASRNGDRSSEARTLSVRQRAFLREKILGSNDKEAALAAGYSPSVAENTKQKIWAKPGVLIEFKRLKERFYNAAMMSNRKQRREDVASEQHLR